MDEVDVREQVDLHHDLVNVVVPDVEDRDDGDLDVLYVVLCALC